MTEAEKIEKINNLSDYLEGDVFIDETSRLIYATDASAYREKPLAVIRPKNSNDILKAIAFASKYKIPIIPRAAGTSLAGQVVGNGIIVDVSKYLTNIIELNEEELWVRVEPGVVLDELNKFLATKGLFFGPETSTSNRCMIGGMVGNNSCGSHSLIYGSTRDHTLEIKAFLSDGSEVIFKSLNTSEFEAKCLGNNLESNLYKNIKHILSNTANQKEINAQYPDKRIHRRNTGYAIDVLLETDPFNQNNIPFNFCKLLAGSEGTLAFTIEIKLNLVPLPPKEVALICIHTHTLEEAFEANLIALKHKPTSIELMDKTILDLTKYNHELKKNRFFLNGDPGAILIVEFAKETREEINTIVTELETDMRKNGFGYHFPVIFGADTKKVWNIRKAGLGVLSTMPGDAKPVSVIEDTAVHPEVLPQYMKEFKEVLKKYHLDCVYYAHIATGEIHLKPILNLKNLDDVELFHTIAKESARLVKKFKGSLSGEHGDGRLRGEFIPYMIGDHCYSLLKQIKQTWDPDYIFNPRKITDTPPMNSNLRFKVGGIEREIKTIFDFSKDRGILRAVEKCNGSADCRKSEIIGGTMCPSFMASKNEKQTTRARANLLREYLTNSKKENPFDHKELYQIFDLCISCKACKSECPSGMDIAKLKAEFLQHYYDSNGVPFRTNVIANLNKLNKYLSYTPTISNFLLGLGKGLVGFTTNRKLPQLYKNTLDKFFEKHHQNIGLKSKVYLFSDEFTNYYDTEIGIKAIILLNKLGYEVAIPIHFESTRTYISKGLIRKAREIAKKNVSLLQGLISESTPLIGIEPSAILTFRDEYPELVGNDLKNAADKLAINTFLIDEFISSEFSKGNILNNSFTKKTIHVKLHGHCQQKAIASTATTISMLSIPENYVVSEIPSGCCGMAGAFGYEKEHYKLSMQIGELILFPTIRKLDSETIITATGTSCRHQIYHGTGRKALHPVEVLYNALI